MILEDFRTIAMLDWLKNDLLLTVDRCEPASSDASFRRYFRITLPGEQFVVMDAPPDKENLPAFIKVDELLARSGVRVPGIRFKNEVDGFLVLEDFGTQSYLDRLTTDNAGDLYGAALNSLLTLQLNVDTEQSGLPRYDEALLRRELGIFDEWFVGRTLEKNLPETVWNDICNLLVESALAQPTVCVHRDYHSRNLMLLVNGEPGIIDFQDAVIGPVTYDLVSLLRDCYIAWPQERIDGWLAGHWERLRTHGIVDRELEVFTRWFDLMGLQRHLKAIGIFSRLNLRDGKAGYLKDIPRTLGYVLAQTEKYPEFSDFHRFLQEEVAGIYGEPQ